MPRGFIRLSGLLCLGLVLGCGQSLPTEDVPPLQPVSGKVTIDNKPAVGVSVTFLPARSTTGNGAYATTGADGSYTLQYRSGDPGIPVGDYVVVFSKLTQPDGSPIPEGQTPADLHAVDQIPERYRSPEAMEHTVSVPEGGKPFDFDLRST